MCLCVILVHLKCTIPSHSMAINIELWRLGQRLLVTLCSKQLPRVWAIFTSCHGQQKLSLTSILTFNSTQQRLHRVRLLLEQVRVSSLEIETKRQGLGSSGKFQCTDCDILFLKLSFLVNNNWFLPHLTLISSQCRLGLGCRQVGNLNAKTVRRWLMATGSKPVTDAFQHYRQKDILKKMYSNFRKYAHPSFLP